MAVLRKQHKTYKKPRKSFEAARIAEEHEIIKKYGLKNKREIWKAETTIAGIRKQAKSLITSSQEKQQELIKRLSKIGIIKTDSKIDDILELTKENWLNRRLQTLVHSKGLAKTPKEARQLITHRHISLNNKIVTIPSYVVTLEEEGKINLLKKQKVKQNGES